MKRNNIRHYGLVPAKNNSSRCRDKNWRSFLGGKCLVDFTLATIPDGIFDKVIVSTDRIAYRPPAGAVKHLREKRLATKRACIKDLMQLLIRRYGMSGKDYLWLLNPTSPFRTKEDYRSIAKIIEKDGPDAVISCFSVSPFVWRSSRPLFKTEGKRRGTDDFGFEYTVENGMFYAVNVGHFRGHNSWYGKAARLYKQDGVFSSVDIDSEKDFKEAQKIGRFFKSK
ncbi:MAG: hypothetical protein JW919_00745 [Candidatus Omnitrophica bacterium]|nr:hypothetical protein [Candidatus Omnitrophota bacterium]